MSDKDYLDAFMGRDSRSFQENNFSFMALIFGPFYLLYKKIYTISLLFFFGILLIYSYHEELALFLILVSHLYLGFQFPSIYFHFCQKKVDEIRLSNPEKTSYELLDLCRKEGSHSIPISVVILIEVIMVSFILYSGIKKMNQNKSLKKDSLYHLTYEIPNDFQPGKYNMDSYKHYYYMDSSNDCSITITTSFQQNNLDELEDYSIGGNHWKREKDSYYMEYKDTLYKVEFLIKKGNYCEGVRERFLFSCNFFENK